MRRLKRNGRHLLLGGWDSPMKMRRDEAIETIVVAYASESAEGLPYEDAP